MDDLFYLAIGLITPALFGVGAALLERLRNAAP